MPLIPLSGPISMSMFNTAVNRTANTANSLLAGGEVPADPGLFYLGYQYNNTLNQDAPHAMSEWYGFDIISYEYRISSVGSESGYVDACNNQTATTVVYAATNDPTLVSGFYTDSNLATEFTGNGDWYKFYLYPSGDFYAAQINGLGVVTDIQACPPPTTTSTTTTTTTAAPVTFYELTLCTAGGPNPAYTTNGPFSLNERVVYAGSLYYIVSSVAKTNPPDTPVGTQISVTSTGETGCPTTTTTTTTLPPLTATNGPITCAGSVGSFTTTFTGGTGTYVTAAIDINQAGVGQRLGGGAGTPGQGQTVILSPGATSYTWTGLNEGTSWYVGVRDSANGSDLTPQITITCPATTTSTTTTTTTVQPQFTVYGGVDQTEACNSTTPIQVYSNTNSIGIGAVITIVPNTAWTFAYLAYAGNVYAMAGSTIDTTGTSCSGFTTTSTTTTTTTNDGRYNCIQTGPSTYECQQVNGGTYADLSECQGNCPPI